MRRIVLALPALRRELLRFPLLGTAVIHGDVHSGNVLVRRRGGLYEPVLLDWARARIGSPLEDVSSWIESLGCWEPVAKRRHDTLLAGYLAARGTSTTLTRALRDAYWLAAASNALSGALVYHLTEAMRPDIPASARRAALQNAANALRILRRADPCWR